MPGWNYGARMRAPRRCVAGICPPAEALAADQRITAYARELKAAGLDGTMDQLRARAFLDLALGICSRPMSPPRHDTRAAGHDADAEFANFRAYVEKTIRPWMHDVDPDTGFSYEIVGFLPGMGLPEDHELSALVKQTTGSNSTGKVSYGTEGGVYEEAGIPSIVCGPGSIQQAHKPDEWIEIAQLDACDLFIRHLVARYAA